MASIAIVNFTLHFAFLGVTEWRDSCWNTPLLLDCEKDISKTKEI